MGPRRSMSRHDSRHQACDGPMEHVMVSTSSSNWEKQPQQQQQQQGEMHGRFLNLYCSTTAAVAALLLLQPPPAAAQSCTGSTWTGGGAPLYDCTTQVMSFGATTVTSPSSAVSGSAGGLAGAPVVSGNRQVPGGGANRPNGHCEHVVYRKERPDERQRHSHLHHSTLRCAGG